MTPHLVLGPVFSHYGFKNWTLLFLPEELICVPHGFWPSVKMGFIAALLAPRIVHALVSRESARAGEEWSTVDSARLPAGAWRLPLSTVRRIELRRKQLSASELRIQQTGQREHVFGIYDVWQLGPCARTLRQTYPRLYFEQ
ncbi:MAG TPA: hypothetical protein VGB96_15230 [Archangium sp.]|jgi:hypothetical protein